MNNLLLTKNVQDDKDGNIIEIEGKSNSKNKKDEKEVINTENNEKKAPTSKVVQKKTTVNFNHNKYANIQTHQNHAHQHNYNRYGIYPVDRNTNQALKDNNHLNRPKNNMEINKVKTGGNHDQGGHNHSLSISVVTINDEIVFNSETNPNENNFNLDDTEVLRKNAFKRPEDNNSLKDKKGLSNYDKPIIQFNQFNTFQVKQESTPNPNNNKINFFGRATNYDKIFEQLQSSKARTKNVKQNLVYPTANDPDKNTKSNNPPSLANLKNSLITNTNTSPVYEFNANFHHEINDNKTPKLFDFDYLPTNTNREEHNRNYPNNAKKDNEKITFFDFFNDNKKKRNVKSVEHRKTNEKSEKKDKVIDFPKTNNIEVKL